MQVVLDACVKGGALRLPSDVRLPDGQVRVVLLYETPQQATAPPGAETMVGVIARLMRKPLVVPDFVPFSRDEAHGL
jgi:hypothetical protein